ncbi:alpha/beta fold hydrolase [Streptomyces sp. NPDC060002]|uniref:alpha/beta fold hydrolase n=1 Tax=Streptomyces sp. NPDC060002 TaxID=3347033 RepID=UPI0036B4DA1A
MRGGVFDVGGTGLYREVRGSGPALPMISGAGGDAGYRTAVAEDLADAFTVITHDRRGNSRSEGPTDRDDCGRRVSPSRRPTPAR